MAVSGFPIPQAVSISQGIHRPSVPLARETRVTCQGLRLSSPLVASLTRNGAIAGLYGLRSPSHPERLRALFPAPVLATGQTSEAFSGAGHSQPAIREPSGMWLWLRIEEFVKVGGRSSSEDQGLQAEGAHSAI